MPWTPPTGPIPGSVRVTGFIAPSVYEDTYAVTDDEYNRGGFRPVADTTARDAITEDRRKVGMLVYSIADDKYYRCTDTVTPTWVEAEMNGGIIRDDITYYVDGAAGDDANDGLAWGTAKQTFGFLIAGEVDSLPRRIDADVIVYFRNDIRARNSKGNLQLRDFYGSGSLTIEGVLTAEETFTVSSYDNVEANRYSRHWVDDSTKAWTPNEWRHHFAEVATGYEPELFYPVLSNTSTKLVIPYGRSLTGTPNGTIYSAPQLLIELVTDPGVLYSFDYSEFFKLEDNNIEINIKNFWIDSRATYIELPNFSKCTYLHISHSYFPSGIFIADAGEYHLDGCFLQLNSFAGAWGLGPLNVNFYACTFYSSDNTGTTGPDEQARFTFMKCYFYGLDVAMWGAGNSVIDSRFENYIEACDFGILLSNSYLSLFDLSGGTRFDACTKGIESLGSDVFYNAQTIYSWDTPTEISFGETDTATFAELAANTIQSRANFRVVYSDAGYEPVPKDEYNNTVSGLTAVNYQAAIDELAASGGGGAVTPKFVISSPRTVASADHNLSLVGLVPAGLTVNLPAVTPGTTVRLTCVGYNVTALVSGCALAGPSVLTGAAGFRLQAVGHAVDLIFLGTPPLGAPTWGVVGGQGTVYITNGSGTPTGTSYNFAGNIPSGASGSFVKIGADYNIIDSSVNADTLVARAIHWTYADETARLAATGLTIADVGKWALQSSDSTVWQLSNYGPVTWFEVSPAGAGSSAASILLEAATIDLIDDTDFTLLEDPLAVIKGTGYLLTVTPTTGTGLLTVELYQDAARLVVVKTMSVDLTDATTFVDFEAFGFDLETDGTIYGTAFVSGVGGSETFDISLNAIALTVSTSPTPLPTPYGQGIEDDGGGQPRIALASNGGLGFDIGDNLVITPDVTAPATIALGVGGASVTGAVTTTTDEDIAAKKRFTAVGSEPLVAAGYPTAGTYLTGHEIVDVNLVKWRCTDGGTPGLWQLVDCVADLEADYATASLAPGAIEMLSIPVTGDYGVLQHIQVWGVVADPDDYSSDFRARIFLTADGFGRDLVWQGVGIVRQSYLLAQLDAATSDLSVNDEDQFDTDEAIIVYEDDDRYELARITERTANQISIDEILVDASSWAADTLVCGVTQFDAVPFRNGDPSNRQKVFLQIRNDSDVNSVIFYARVLPVSFGTIRMELT